MINLSNLKFIEFINAYKLKNRNDKITLDNITKFPKLFFFSEKLKIFKLVWPLFSNLDICKIIIGQFDKPEYIKYKNYITDINMLLHFLKYDDMNL